MWVCFVVGAWGVFWRVFLCAWCGWVGVVSDAHVSGLFLFSCFCFLFLLVVWLITVWWLWGELCGLVWSGGVIGLLFLVVCVCAL